jgi:hypothetical protein
MSQLFEQSDKMGGFKEFASSLERYICVDREFVDGSLVLCLCAPFGSGKTSFLEMWKKDLELRGNADSKVPIPVVLNAWESDHTGDPLLHIVSGLSKSLRTFQPNTQQIDKIKEAAIDAAWFGLALANGIVASTTGVDAVAAGIFVKERNANNVIPDLLGIYEARITALQKLKLALRSALEGQGRTAFVFVDELDRCRPNYAVEYLETIKHVFDLREIVFVIAADLDQLQCSVKILFGTSHFDEYLRKFVHRKINLPEMDEERARRLVDYYSSRYLVVDEGPGARKPWVQDYTDIKECLREMIIAFRFTPRQVQEVFRLVGHVIGVAGEKGGHLFWGHPITTVFMSAVSVGRPDIYRKIGREEVEIRELMDLIVENIHHADRREWWIVFLTLACAPSHYFKDYTLILSEWKRVGVLPDGSKSEDVRERFRGYSGAWGQSNSRPAKKIFYMIQSVRSFAAE